MNKLKLVRTIKLKKEIGFLESNHWVIKIKSDLVRSYQKWFDIFDKVVWFMIAEDERGKYYINLFYDNKLNQANGEDL